MNFFQGLDMSLLNRLSALAPDKFEKLTQTNLFSQISALSGMPMDPWERIKWQYLGKDFKYPTIEEIPSPINFDTQHCVCCLSSIAADMTNSTIQKVSSFTNSTTGILLEPLTGIDLNLNEKYIKSSIIITELVRSIPMSEIYARPYETAAKILNYYIGLNK